MKTFAILSLGVILPCLAQSAPSRPTIASGVMSKDESVRISGTGFGTHPDYHTDEGGKLAWQWHDFETSLFQDGFHHPTGRPETVDYWQRTDVGGRSGYYGRRFNINASGDDNVHPIQSPQTNFDTNTVFISYWQKNPSNPIIGQKTLRMTWNKHQNPDGFSYCYTNMGNNNFSTYGVQPPEPKVQNTDWNTLAEVPKDRWVRIDMLFQGGVTEPKTQKIWVIDEGGSVLAMEKHHDEVAVYNTFSLSVGAGMSPAASGPEHAVWFDDVYVDFTQARVELCDSPTWDARAHCEVQLASAWSGSEITFKVNAGSFGSGDTAYLYVVDSDGEVSPAGQVTMGQSRAECSTGAACSSLDGCQSGTVECATGVTICSGLAALADGTACMGGTCVAGECRQGDAGLPNERLLSGAEEPIEVDHGCSAPTGTGPLGAFVTLTLLLGRRAMPPRRRERP